MLEVDPVAEHGPELRRSQEPDHDGGAGEGHQRARHHGRRLVRVRLAAVPAEEREQDAAGHVERRHHGDREQHEEEPGPVLPRAHEQLVLRPEACEREDAGERGRADQERPERDGHVVLQPAHVAHVVRVDRVDHRPGPEEEQRLEERVGEQVEEPGGDALGSEGQTGHHVGQLRQRGVREHPLDVVLHEGEERGPERRDRRDHAHDREHERVGMDEDLEHPPDQVDARRHHRRGVDQGGDGRGAGHRIGQPDVQGELGGLADRAPEQQERRRRDEGRGDPRLGRSSRRSRRCSSS